MLAVLEELDEAPNAGAHAHDEVQQEHEEEYAHEPAQAEDAAGQPVGIYVEWV